MAKCRYCGEEYSISFLRRLAATPDLCDACQELRKAHVQQYVAKLKEFGRDSYLDAGEEAQLAELQERLGLTTIDLRQIEGDLRRLRAQTKRTDVERFQAQFQEIANDGRLEPQEESELMQLKQRLGLSDDEVRPTLRELEFLRFVTALDDGTLPVFNDKVDVLLRPGELCHLVVRCRLVENSTRTGFVGLDGGYSAKAGESSTWNAGGFAGQVTKRTVQETTDAGCLHVTNQRVLFVGASKTASYPISKIVQVHLFERGVQFQSDGNSRSRWFLFDFPGDEREFYWVAQMVNTLVLRLASGPGPANPGASRPNTATVERNSAVDPAEPAKASSLVALMAYQETIAAAFVDLQERFRAWEESVGKVSGKLYREGSSDRDGLDALASASGVSYGRFVEAKRRIESMEVPLVARSAHAHFVRYAELLEKAESLVVEAILVGDPGRVLLARQPVDQAQQEMALGLSELQSAVAAAVR